MGFAVQRSSLQQLTRSTLQQRGSASGLLYAWYENIWIRKAIRIPVVFPSNADPQMPDQFLLDIQQIPWSAIPPHVPIQSPFDWPTADIFRAWEHTIDTDAGGLGDIVDYGEQGRANIEPIPLGSPFGSQGWFSLGYATSIYGNTFLRGKIGSGNTATYPDFFVRHQYSALGQTFAYQQNCHMAACWSWAASDDWPLFPDLAHHTFNSWVQVQRSRFKWNKPSFGWLLKGDIYNRIGTPQRPHVVDDIGWDNPDYYIPYGSLRYSLQNARVYRGVESRAADVFVEPPLDFPVSGFPTSTFRQGLIGQAIFAIDWETPAQFVARTGIVVDGA